MLFASAFTFLLVSLFINELNKLLETGLYYIYMRVILFSFGKLCFEFKIPPSTPHHSKEGEKKPAEFLNVCKAAKNTLR